MDGDARDGRRGRRVSASALALVAALAGPARAASMAEVGGAEVASPLLAGADAAVLRGIRGRAFPGAVLAVGRGSGALHLRAFGRLSFSPEEERTRLDTRYDLASLTKAVATTAVAMVLVDRGSLALDAPLARWFPETEERHGRRATVRDLLRHSAGLPGWRALSRETADKRGVIQRIATLEAEYEPGTRSLYSDLGMMLLGDVVGRVAGLPLDAAARELVFQPLGMLDTGYRPAPELRPRIAPTEFDPWRGRLLRGEPQDENAYRMDGVAGHAGLFGSAPDLCRFAEMMLRQGAYPGGRLVRGETVDLFTRRADVPGSTRTLGWETPAGDSWSGRLWSASAYGHTGQTGTSLWIDPARDLYLVLLTNRVSSRGDDYDHVRRELADAVLSALPDPPRPRPVVSPAERR